MKRFFILLLILFAGCPSVPASAADEKPLPGAAPPALADVLAGRFRWVSSAPLIAAVPAVDEGLAIKDPSVVFFDNRWHIYATLRNEKHAYMEYLNFADWQSANAAPRTVIKMIDKYHCAPEVFYFKPRKKWYLIYQAAALTETGFFGPVYSTMEDVSKPKTLTAPIPLFSKQPENVKHWIDFWVICDQTHAYLFFTGDDGQFWRSRTAIGDFPSGWSKPESIIQQKKADFFEASHTYRLKGLEQYLTIVEAIGPQNRRYYKAFLADRLDGEWKPAAAAWDKPMASINNVTFAPGVEPWTDSISHGELLREGYDEHLEVDPAHIRFLFQGCSAKECEGRNYSQFPWRLGILEPDRRGSP